MEDQATANEALFAAIAIADMQYEEHWTAHNVKRKKEFMAMLQRHQAEKAADAKHSGSVRQRRNADFRKDELEDMRRQHEQEEMMEQETETRRVFAALDMEYEKFCITALRARRHRHSFDDEGFIPRGVLFDLRQKNPKRLLEKLEMYGDQSAIVGQAFLELSLLVSGRKDLCESVKRLGGCKLIMAGMKRFPDSFFVQEQGVNVMFRLSCVSSCALDLLDNGAFEVLTLTLGGLGESVECKPVRLMVLRSLDSLYSKVGQLVMDKRRPAEDERQAMHVTNCAMVQQPRRARLHEAGVRLITTLGALREENFRWLFEEEAFAHTLTCLLNWYDSFDVRVPRADAAAVIREIMRLLQVICVSCGGALVSKLLTVLFPTLLDRLAVALDRHFADPLVQLAYAQLWEVLLDRHLPIARTVVLAHKAPATVATFLCSMRQHIRIHALHWKHLSNLTRLYRAGAGSAPNVVPKSVVIAQLVLDNDAIPLFEDLVAECAGNRRVMHCLLTFLSVYAADFRFLVSLNRDENKLRDSLRATLPLHVLDPHLTSLGKTLMAKLHTE